MRSWILALMLLFSAGCFAGDSPGDAPSGLIHQKSIHDGLSYRGRSGTNLRASAGCLQPLMTVKIGSVTAVIILIKHRENIGRLARGEEPKMSFKK